MICHSGSKLPYQFGNCPANTCQVPEFRILRFAVLILIKSCQTANEVLKQAGLPKRF